MLPRPKLEYHPDGHPVLSRGEIESHAETLLKLHFPDNLIVPTPLKAVDLIKLIEREDGVTMEVKDLGSESRRKRLGRMYLKKKIIVLDQVLFGERQVSLPFVMAHEFAHWLLHRDCSITAIKDREQFPDDGDESEGIDKFILGWSATDWLEWQASKLAACLLMPKVATQNTLAGVQREMDIPVRRGIIYENLTPQGRAESDEQITWVAKLFDVSKTVARIRLADLGMYEQQEKKIERVGKAHNPFTSINPLWGES